MRASLLPATSLLALLLLGGTPGFATPTTATGAPDDANCACVQTPSALRLPLPQQPDFLTNGYVNIATIFYAATGQPTFAPINPPGSTERGAGSAFETISTINQAIVLDHTRPGKLAAASSGWSNSGGTSVYVGSSANLPLRDGSSGSSSTYGYGFNPTGGSAGAPTDDSAFAVTHATFIPNSASTPPAASRAVNKLSRSVQPSGPVFSSSIVGSGVANTPSVGQQSLIDFGTIEVNSTHTLDLSITNLATDVGNSGSDLTIEGYSISGADPGSFSASLTPGTVIPAGGTLLVPLTVVGTGPGDLTSNLTIFTNEGASAGAAGETFNYLLDPMVVTGLSIGVPEPASIALLGAGLGGLASILRRRR